MTMPKLPFVVISRARFDDLEARIAAFEAKAKAQFEVRSNAQKNRAKPATASEGATPLAPQSAAGVTP